MEPPADPPERERAQGPAAPHRAAQLERSRHSSVEWWQRAYYDDSAVVERFLSEAAASLPAAIIDTSGAEADDVFDALMLHRSTLRRDQRLAEWEAPGGR